MRLVASMIVRNEMGRYLQPCVQHLTRFCDEIVVLDDASDDGTFEWLREFGEPVTVRTLETPAFVRDEGAARQALLDDTFAAKPTHVLAIDADEFIADGPRLRELTEAYSTSGHVIGFMPVVNEIWSADELSLSVRVDGNWPPFPTTLVWRAPREEERGPAWSIPARRLASGREPVAVRLAFRSGSVAALHGVDMLHFGWANRQARQARFERYMAEDGGDFHARQHLESIMFPPEKIRVLQLGWPLGLEEERQAILEAVRR